MPQVRATHVSPRVADYAVAVVVAAMLVASVVLFWGLVGP
jgi:hypothetical protein